MTTAAGDTGGTGGTGGTGTGGTGGGGDAGTGGTGAGGTGNGAATPPWHGLTDATDVAYVTNKGWKTPADVYKSYRGVETLVGRDPSTLLTIPRADDAAGQRAVFAKLGMPETADKYEVPLPEGADPAYANFARDTFHKLGLTAAQAKELTLANNDFMAKHEAETAKTYERAVAMDKQALLTEWRGGYERMMNSAQTAVKAMGFSAEMVDALETSLGYAGVMKFFAGLGQKLGEDKFVGTEHRQQGFGATQTPDEARGEYEKMLADQTQVAALKDKSHPGHAAAQRKQNDLFKIMYPD